MVTYARLRHTVNQKTSHACLERGEFGLDGVPVEWNRSEKLSRSYARVRVCVAFLSFVVLVSFSVYSMAVARAKIIGDAHEHIERDDPHSVCSHYQHKWVRVISLRDLGLNMSFPRIISHGDETKETLETVDDARCLHKKVKKVRHVTIVVAYIPLEDWPYSTERFITLVGSLSVCVQHSIDLFDDLISCNDYI
jgi:hypothetical protein